MTIGKFAALMSLPVLLALGACDDSAAEKAANVSANPGERESLIATLDGVRELSTAAAMLRQAGLEKALNGPAPYTLFVPTDEAFKAVDTDTLARLNNDEGRPELIALLRYHIAPGVVTQKDLMSAIDGAGGTAELANVAQGMLAFSKQGERVAIGSGDQAAMIVSAPIETSNGVIYSIDRLIAPQE